MNTVLDNFQPIFPSSRAPAEIAETIGSSDINPNHPHMSQRDHESVAQDLDMKDPANQRRCEKFPNHRTPGDTTFLARLRSGLRLPVSCLSGVLSNVWGINQSGGSFLRFIDHYTDILSTEYRDQTNALLGTVVAEIRKSPKDFLSRIGSEISNAAAKSLGDAWHCKKPDDQISAICNIATDLVPAGILAKILIKAPLAAEESLKLARVIRETVDGGETAKVPTQLAKMGDEQKMVEPIRDLNANPLNDPDLELGRGGRYLTDEEFARYMMTKERREKELRRRRIEEGQAKRLDERRQREEELRARQEGKISPLEVRVPKGSPLSPSQLAYSDLPNLSGNIRNGVELKLGRARIEKPLERIDQGLDNSNESYYVTFEGGLKAVWKPHVEFVGVNYRAEILAYEIDKKFGFNLVPPTVERTIDGRIGSLQLFMPSRFGKKVNDDEMDKLLLFDFIVDNRDRTITNYLISPDGKLIAIDHGMTFTAQGGNGTSFFKKRQAIERYLKTPPGVSFMKTLSDTLGGSQFKRDVQSYLGTEIVIGSSKDYSS